MKYIYIPHKGSCQDCSVGLIPGYRNSYITYKDLVKIFDEDVEVTKFSNHYSIKTSNGFTWQVCKKAKLYPKDLLELCR